MEEGYTGSFSEVEWEEHFSTLGMHHYLEKQQELMDKGCASVTSAGNILLHKYTDNVATLVAAYIEDKFYNKSGNEVSDYRRPTDYYAIANSNIQTCSYIAIRAVLDNVTNSKETSTPTHRLADYVGSSIENELAAFALHKNKQAVHKTFTNNFTNTPRGVSAKQRAFREALKEFGWERWSRSLRDRVGHVYITAMIQTGLLTEERMLTYNSKVKKSTTVRVVTLEESVLTWIQENTLYMSQWFGYKLPMIEPPAVLKDGTYHQRYVKHSSNHLFLHKSSFIPESVYEAANKISSVPYTLNTKLYYVFKSLLSTGNAPDLVQLGEPPEFPLSEKDLVDGKVVFKELSPPKQEIYQQYSEERAAYYAAKSKNDGRKLLYSKLLMVSRELHNVHQRLGADKFYFPVYLDFRGRLYFDTVGLNPQGSDTSKALLQFHEKKRLGSRGRYWLGVHGANLYGNDKVSLDDRSRWSESNSDMFTFIAENPTSPEALDIWGDADKPYQFLAFCFEWAEMIEVGEDNFYSGLPIAMDGSCNGIQHYSGMMFDEVGGRATNLIDGELPSDIYKEVADVLEQMAKEADDEDGYLALWLKHGLNRKVTKRSVMTLPYGICKHTCSLHLKDYADENCEDVMPTPNIRAQASLTLAPLLWEAMNQVVVKGKEVMAWLQECATIINTTGRQTEFTAISGLEVKAKYLKQDTKNMDLFFSGERRQIVTYVDTPKVNKVKSRNALAPNLVHSCDASHLMATAVAFDGSILPVHDSYATHACDVDEMGKCTRQEFINMYKDGTFLDKFKKELEDKYEVELPPLPEKGNLNLTEVLSSKYFFS